jgi:hypothetical protein
MSPWRVSIVRRWRQLFGGGRDRPASVRSNSLRPGECPRRTRALTSVGVLAIGSGATAGVAGRSIVLGIRSAATEAVTAA